MPVKCLSHFLDGVAYGEGKSDTPAPQVNGVYQDLVDLHISLNMDYISDCIFANVGLF